MARPFTGSLAASTQSVVAGSYKAVEYIKGNIQLDENADFKASTEKSKEVVKICTRYAQHGMLNIFIAVFCFTLAYAFFSAPSGDNVQPVSFFISYLISIAVFVCSRQSLWLMAVVAGIMLKRSLRLT